MGLLDIGSRPQSVGLSNIGLRKTIGCPPLGSKQQLGGVRGNGELCSFKIFACSTFFVRSEQKKIILLHTKAFHQVGQIFKHRYLHQIFSFQDV